MVAASEQPPVATPAAAVKPRVLIIDDELGPRESLRFLLKNDYEVLVAETVVRGLEQIKKSAPDVIVMDIRMPGMTGIEGLREIRKLDQNVAIIMLTGFGALETAQEAIRLGANDYMKKPFDAAEMREAVRRNLQRSQVNRKRALAQRDLADLNSQLQGELHNKERMASIGLASAELVHDLRNPLTVVMGYIQLLGDELAEQRPATGERVEYLDAIRRSVARCKDLVESWLSISRHGPVQHVPCNLRTIAAGIVDELRPLAATKNATLRLNCDAPLAHVLGDAIQLARIVQNLIANAVESLPSEKGDVQVTVTHRGDRLILEVCDNGHGIGAADLEHIFDPFYTSKRASGGTGLGLFITRRIVEDHKGSIGIVSQPGKGTTVTVGLPCHEPAP